MIGGREGGLIKYNRTGGELCKRAFARPLNVLSTNHDSSLVAVACDDHKAYVMSSADLQDVHVISHNSDVWAVAFSTTSAFLATSEERGSICRVLAASVSTDCHGL